MTYAIRPLKTVTIVVQLRVPNARNVTADEVASYVRSAIKSERGHYSPEDSMFETEIYRDRIVVMMP